MFAIDFWGEYLSIAKSSGSKPEIKAVIYNVFFYRQEALMVKSQIDTIELDLSEAEEIRGVTENTANLTKSNVTTINQLATQVSEGVLELVKGRFSSR